METIKLNLYGFDELSKTAKQKALTAYHELNIDFNWWDGEYDDFIEICAYLGIAVKKESIKFEGFYSQGDGSGFSATVDFIQLNKGIITQAWKVYAPKLEFDFTEIGIDRRVIALVESGVLEHEPKIISRSRNYGVVVDLGIYAVNERERSHDLVFEELDNLETWLRKIAETLNKRLYRSLETQYEYLTSDDAIAEGILANEYFFTADGKSANHLRKLSENN
jgi:hypothetical protein